jgi:nucleoside phosphorylase
MLTMSHYDNYTVGWICALPLEMAASKIMLDKTHDALPPPRNDNNSYIYGEIAQHNIVIACLPSGVYGKVSAANVATQMSRTFRNLQYRFMVGIGAGIPSESADIRLGDVVVSMPTNNSPGVVQYDFGKQFHTGFQRSGTMNKPPQDHLTALSTYRALARINTDPIPRILAETSGKRNEMSGRLVAPSRNHDRLFRADYHHYPQADSCERCDSRMLVSRPKRAETGPFVHYGLIASGDILLKDPRTRDRLRDQEGAICVEMEAAGLMDTFGCLVVRGICDYADSHKNDDWQPYAAVVAAAFTKGLLESIPQSSVEPIPRKNWFEDFARHNPRHARDRIHQQSGGLLRESYEWILENHDYVAWATREQGSLLWIHGNPGTGKTMLLLGIIEELSKTALPGHLVYFFCYSGEVDSSTSILKGMIYSLLFDHPYIRAQVQKRYTHDGSHANSAEIFFFGDIFRFILSMIPRSPTYILIDGLDECGKGIQELKHLIQQTLNQFPYVRWIVSSRNDAEIERLASKVRPMIDISLQPSDAQVSKAVDSYLAWQISELSIPKLTAWSRLRMRMDLERLSEGTYLWAQFACKELRSMTSYEPSRGFNEMPSELTQMYARMMKKISDTLSPEDLSVCTQLLAVMAVIYEPIRVVNLPSVLKFPDLTDDPIDWVEKCSPLLIIRNDKVCFIHESARKFLILSKEDPAYFQSSAHAGLVLQSLSYLSDTLKQDICNLSDPGFSIEGKPFPSHNRLESVKYASLYWVDHLNQACTLSGDGTFHELSDAIDIFLRKFFLFWLESMVLLKSYSKGIHMIKALKDIVQVMITLTDDEVPLQYLTPLYFRGRIFQA